MKLAIVTACPGGQVTSVLAARLLRGAAERLGWETCVEANAGSRPEGELSAEQIAEADWVLPVSYTHLRAHETLANLVCRLLLEKKKTASYTHQRAHETVPDNVC
ncbi:PTS fructose transporter subunit IIB, partial [Pseudomonas aeruginosa]|uniref:PTS fructose transporter subunit IIB n=1 Tax=Pseudomonas aeruginosa TaxID=287 RepID=UPI0027E4FB24